MTEAALKGIPVHTHPRSTSEALPANNISTCTMKLRLAATILSSATAELTRFIATNSGYFLLGGGTDIVDVVTDESLLERHEFDAADDNNHDEEEQEQGILPEWNEKVDRDREEDIATQSSNEDEGLGRQGRRKRLADEMKEKEALQARLEEVERKSKASWCDTSKIMGYLSTASMFVKLYQVVGPSVMPAAAPTTKLACNTVVNQFIDSSAAQPICDTLSYAVESMDLTKVKDEVKVINLIEDWRINCHFFPAAFRFVRG
eukprot:scaffold25427_cov78-Skeletonema_dohrnii-CCMP3373.AAC.2